MGLNFQRCPLSNFDTKPKPVEIRSGIFTTFRSRSAKPRFHCIFLELGRMHFHSLHVKLVGAWPVDEQSAVSCFLQEVTCFMTVAINVRHSP